MVMMSGVCGGVPILRSYRGQSRLFCASTKKEKVIVISGPTGAGKSRLALELAKRLDGEIIIADSVYRGLDVGSAKPSSADRKEGPHHLIDILHPSEDYSVGQFFEDARQATKDVLNNGRVPIVTGGTGLYLWWLIYGKPDVPKASPEIVAEAYSELIHLQKDRDWDAAVELVVKAGDPKAQSLAANDWYQLRPSLEIIKHDSPLACLHLLSEYCMMLSGTNLIQVKQTTLMTGALLLVCLNKIQRNWIMSSFAFSFQVIGLISVDKLMSGVKISFQAMEYLLKCRQEGGISSTGEFYAFLSEFQKVSRNFAKRQMTWFHNESIHHWLNASKPLEKVLDFIIDAYHDQTGNLAVPKTLQMEKDLTRRISSAVKIVLIFWTG